MKRRSILVLLLATSLAGAPAESRSASVDFVVLMDTSLSMADAMAAAKRYAAGEIIGRLVEHGDWVSVLKFYGKTEVAWQGDIADDSDIAAVVRSLNDLKADGRFTDIGNALDSMDKILSERGFPDRPKYILLLTDERQEAPKDSRYYSPDYVASHPLLEYIKRIDMGSFRVITIGYGLSARVEVEARTLMTTLSEPPSRPEQPLAGAGSAGTDAVPGTSGTASSIATGNVAAGQSQAGSDAQAPGTAAQGTGAGTSTGGSAEKPGRGFYGAPIAAAIAAAGAAGIIIALAVAKRRRRKDDEERKPRAESGT